MKRPKVPQPRTPKHSIVASIRGKHQKHPPSRQDCVNNYGFNSISHLNEWIDQEFDADTRKEIVDKLNTGDRIEKRKKSPKVSRITVRIEDSIKNIEETSSNEENIGGTMNNITDNTKATTSEATSAEATKQMIRKVSAAIDEVRDLLSALIDWKTDLYEELEFPCYVHPSYNGIIPKYAKIVAWEHLESTELLDVRFNYLNENIRKFVNVAAAAWLENEKTQIFVGDMSIQILLTSLGIPWND